MIFIDKNKKRRRIHSDYWLGSWINDSILTQTMNTKERTSYDIYKLASSKRAVANFVNIISNKYVPVKFNTRGESYTDGEQVVIGANVVNPKDFDVIVGLALHEASHIKLSNFKLLANLDQLIPDSIITKSEDIGIPNPVNVIKSLWNWVEDRRIDFYIFDSAPGYREYYRAMYDKYFNSGLIDKGLLSGEKRTETLDSYMFRIINIHNSKSPLSALKGLRKIYKIIDLQNISRLKNSQDALDVTLEIYKIMLECIKKEETKSDKDGKSNKDENGDGSGDSKKDEPITFTDDEFDELLENSDFSENDDEGDESGAGDESDDEGDDDDGGKTDGISGKPGKLKIGKPSNKKSKSQKIELTPRQKELLEKKITAQKDFVDGEIKKTTITKKVSKEVGQIEKSGSELTTVGQDVPDHYGNSQFGTHCIVVKKLTQSLLESNIFPMSSTSYDNELYRDCETEVLNGIRIGTILGKKLQIRSENRTTVYNRQKIGKIDKRMISSLGFGNENVFQFNEVDTYNNANLHVSIDASSSMYGSKWSSTMTNVTALCKAVDMISGLEIQITFRTTSSDKPYVIMAYDSRIDKFSKVKKMFPCLRACGTTPEGLCYEAIMKEFLASTISMDSYFINLSDGEPWFSNREFRYSGNLAHEHTRKMVKKIENMGIQTLSYFITNSSYGTVSSGFKKMYGKGASLIDVTNLSQIVKTVNNMFLKKIKNK